MKIDKFIIGFIVFAVAMIAGTAMIADANNNYNLTINESEYGDVYDTINDTYDLTGSMKESTIGGEIDDEESWESMTKGSYGAVRQSIGTISVVGRILEALSQKFGIPPVYVKLGILALTISIVFALILLFRGVYRA